MAEEVEAWGRLVESTAKLSSDDAHDALNWVCGIIKAGDQADEIEAAMVGNLLRGWLVFADRVDGESRFVQTEIGRQEADRLVATDPDIQRLWADLGGANFIDGPKGKQ